jgi:hypothetical protein
MAVEHEGWTTEFKECRLWLVWRRSPLWIPVGTPTVLSYILGLVSVAKLRQATTSFVMSVCLFVRPSALNNLVPIRRTFIKFDIWGVFNNMFTKFKIHYNLTRITGTLHEDLHTFISRLILLRVRNVSNKSCRENQNIRIILSNFFRISCRLWDNLEKYGWAGQEKW